MHNQDLKLCAEFGANDAARKQTQHEKTIYFPERKEVKVTLRARRDSKFLSLDSTCNRHFMEWQKIFYSKLGYKNSTIIRVEKENIDDELYFYTLVYLLKFPKKG